MSIDLSRRQFTRRLAAAGLSVACVPLLPRAPRADTGLVYYTWDGYDAAEFMPAFVQRHGTPPTFQKFLDQDEAFTNLSQGMVADVVHPCSERVRRWRGADLLQPIDVSRLSHWGGVFEPLRSLAGSQDQGQQWFIPIDWGSTSVLYRTDLVDITEQSWSLLWDERYAGRLSVGESDTDSVVAAGLMAGVRDPFDMTDDEFARVRELLLRQKSLVKFYWVDQTAMEQALASGEIVATMAWNASFATLKSQGVPVAFMTPKEGVINYCCGLVLSKSAANLDDAYDLIDAMLAPEAGKWLIETMGYGHSNRETYDIVDAATLEGLGLARDPETILTAGVYTREPVRPDVVQKILAELSEVG